MTNNKSKILISALILLSAFAFAQTSSAATSSIIISPATSAKTVGDSVVVTATLNASGNKICAVEGTLSFTNLTCQSITLSSDVTPQVSPTCSSPYFLLGIANCATTDTALLTASVKTVSAGTASVGLTGIDIIGEGVSLGSSSAAGTYTINAVPAPEPVAEKPTTPVKKKVTQTISTPEPTVNEATEDTTVADQQAVEQDIIPSSTATASLASRMGEFFKSPIVIIVLVIILILIAMWLVDKFYLKKNR